MNDISELLSVVILNYKNYEMTIKCVDKLISNNCEFKIVIVDNNSKNGSFEILTEKYKDIFNIVVLNSLNNNGYSAGNNIGIQYIEENTNCKYIGIMNPDIIIEDVELFNNLINKVEEYSLQGITALQITNNIFDPNTIGWKLPSFSDVLLLNSKFISKLINPISYKQYDIESNKDPLALVDVMPGCFFIIDIDIFKELGYFDERTFLYYEENILSYKAKKRNYRFGVSLNDSYIHNHKEKDESLLKLSNKYIDRKILLKSQKIYVENYLKINTFKTFIYKLSIVFNLYIELPLIHIFKLLTRKF